MYHGHRRSAELSLLQMDGLFFLVFCINNTTVCVNTNWNVVHDGVFHINIHAVIPPAHTEQCIILNLTGTVEISGPTILSADGPLSSAAASPWGHSVYTPINYMSNIFHLRKHRSTLTRYNLGHSLPQVSFSERCFGHWTQQPLHLVWGCNM